jgi:hypothetical protein
VQLIDALWTGRASREDVSGLHVALVVELAAFDQALVSRPSISFVGDGGPSHGPSRSHGHGASVSAVA